MSLGIAVGYHMHITVKNSNDNIKFQESCKSSYILKQDRFSVTNFLFKSKELVRCKIMIPKGLALKLITIKNTF